MSETKTKPVLTEKQIAWANAFLRAMGGKGNVEATIAPKPVVTKGSKTPPPEDLKGDLGTLETTAKQGLQEARDQLVGKDEDVSRKKFIGKSIDKGYTDRVTTEVNKIIDAVDKLISSGKEMDDNIRETLLTLHSKLEEGQAHYRDAITGNKKDVKLDKQRQDKVDAIGERMEAITRLMSESTRTQFKREDEVTKLNPKERAKMLKANPEMLKAVISAKPAPAELADVLSEMGDSADGMIKQIIAAHGTDTAYMELLCDKTVGNDLKGASAGGNIEGTFFRGNSTATKLTKAYAMTGETPAFLKGIDTDAKEWLGDEPGDADRNRSGQEQRPRGHRQVGSCPCCVLRKDAAHAGIQASAERNRHHRQHDRRRRGQGGHGWQEGRHHGRRPCVPSGDRAGPGGDAEHLVRAAQGDDAGHQDPAEHLQRHARRQQGSLHGAVRPNGG